MVEVEFDFNQRITVIQGNFQDTFRQIIDKYYQKVFRNPESPFLSPIGTQINIESLWFSANGGKIIPEQTVESQMSEFNKQDKKIKVLVYLLNEDNQEQIFVK